MNRRGSRKTLAELAIQHAADPNKYRDWTPERVVRRYETQGDVSLPRVRFIEGGTNARQRADKLPPTG